MFKEILPLFYELDLLIIPILSLMDSSFVKSGNEDSLHCDREPSVSKKCY